MAQRVVTPFREPALWPEEEALISIIVAAAESASDWSRTVRTASPTGWVAAAGYRDLCLYLIASVDWFVRSIAVETRDPFEEWLIERWRRDIQTEAFRESAQYHYLLAEWEREQ